jgi:hypothetical protein
MRPRPTLASPGRLWPLTGGTGSGSRLHVLLYADVALRYDARVFMKAAWLAGARRDRRARSSRNLAKTSIIQRWRVRRGVIPGSFVSVLPLSGHYGWLGPGSYDNMLDANP